MIQIYLWTALTAAFASGFIVGWTLRGINERQRADNAFWGER